MSEGSLKNTALREIALFAGLLFAGLVVVPALIYLLGPQVLGPFGGIGFSDFFGTISARIRGGDPAAWFLALSPYLAVQTLRLTWFGWRMSGHQGR